MIYLLLGLIIWFLAGMFSFYYWWTSDHDLVLDHVPVMLFAGFLGFFSWPLGWSIHGKTSHKNTVLFKKRKQ